MSNLIPSNFIIYKNTIFSNLKIKSWLKLAYLYYLKSAIHKTDKLLAAFRVEVLSSTEAGIKPFS